MADYTVEDLAPVELLLGASPDPAMSCDIEEEVWPLVCSASEQHPAQIEVLWSCGHVYLYCQLGYDYVVVRNKHRSGCSEHGPDLIPIVVVHERELG